MLTDGVVAGDLDHRGLQGDLNVPAPTNQNRLGITIDSTLLDWISVIAEDLVGQCKQIEIHNAEARLLQRNVASDVFELQAELVKQLSSHSFIMHTVEGFGGEIIAGHIENMVQSGMNSDEKVGQLGEDSEVSSRVKSPVRRKRVREGGDDHALEEQNHSISPLSVSSVHAGQPRKRLRVEGVDCSSPVSGSTEGTSSEGSTFHNSDCSSSNDSGSSDLTTIQPREYWEIRGNMGEYALPTDDEITGEESDVLSENGVPWNSYVARSLTEKSDEDYFPPPWTREDLMDLEKEYRADRGYPRWPPMDYYHAMEEAFITGSIAIGNGLTTDDSEEEYHDVSTLLYSTKLRDERLNHVPNDAGSLKAALRLACRDFSVTQEERIEEDAFITRAWKERQWFTLLNRLESPAFRRCNVKKRISEIFSSTRWTYDFNNDTDWRWFEKSDL